MDLTFNNGSRPILKLERGSNLTYRNLKLHGAHPDSDDYNPNAEHLPGIQIRGTQTVTFDSIGIFNVWGDFIELKNTTNAPVLPTRNITITNSTFDRSGRQGIYVAAVETARIEITPLKMPTFRLLTRKQSMKAA